MKIHEMKYAFDYYKRNGYVFVRVVNWARYKNKRKFGNYKTRDERDGVIRVERVETSENN